MRYLALALLIPVAACGMTATYASGNQDGIAPDGNGASRSYAARDFTRVSLAGPDDVDVRVGPFSVRAEGDPALLDRLVIQRDGDSLRIGRRNGISWTRGSVRVIVSMPRIEEAAIAGSGNLRVARAEGPRFRGAISGSGNLGVADMRAGEAAFGISGSGDVTAAGQAQALTIRIAGSGNVQARGLTAARATVSVSGSGDVNATVRGPADVRLAGSGDIDLGSSARCTTRKSGSGTVRCGG
ncbi:Putative auto-transporter adhesin, head GIN domain [Sphingomonas palmae]|uniref:Putative auto-transporter adhesin, head GIN domain n=1 Tax=Sphingomonas palmae TaxID=1855283 RepID=A0A1H7SCX3_9SPHN|nr:head GIN domain-containing protein [Sphingomonas palmae]SEL70056.1 Putative auto-transporter adhesin, head GIN domain [Sphingomonas palmae]